MSERAEALIKEVWRVNQAIGTISSEKETRWIPEEMYQFGQSLHREKNQLMVELLKERSHNGLRENMRVRVTTHPDENLHFYSRNLTEIFAKNPFEDKAYVISSYFRNLVLEAKAGSWEEMMGLIESAEFSNDDGTYNLIVRTNFELKNIMEDIRKPKSVKCSLRLENLKMTLLERLMDLRGRTDAGERIVKVGFVDNENDCLKSAVEVAVEVSGRLYSYRSLFYRYHPERVPEILDLIDRSGGFNNIVVTNY